MAHLSTTEKQILEKLFDMGGGYVLNFSNRTMAEFFQDDVGIDIYSSKYEYASGSKANYLRGFWIKADEKVVAKSITKLIEYIETQILLGNLERENYPTERIQAGKKIAARLLSGKQLVATEATAKATFSNGNINIALQPEIFDHVQKLLNDGHNFNAVEEAYKIVRLKLNSITGKERATDAFSQQNIVKIFGREPRNQAERDFCEGVKFLHMSIQFLRNEKAHTPAQELDKNLTIHYIALASLAYDLINRKLK